MHNFTCGWLYKENSSCLEMSCVLIHTLCKVFLKPALYFCRTFKASAGGRAYGYSHLLPLCNPFLQPIRASATTADPPSGEPISWKHPPLLPLPCMPSLLSEQSMPHSISWEETNRKKSAHTHNREDRMARKLKRRGLKVHRGRGEVGGEKGL